MLTIFIQTSCFERKFNNLYDNCLDIFLDFSIFAKAILTTIIKIDYKNIETQ